MQLTPLYPITLHLSDRGLEAKLIDAKTNMLFTHEQISYGVLGDLPHQTLIAKVNALATANLAAFPFPKENPTELWLFEAVPMAAPAIRQAKEYVKQEQFAKALELFATASKLQKMQGGQADELERAMRHIQKKQDCLTWQQQASFYLPMQEIQHFMEILNAYSDMDDIYACFEALVQAEDKRLPHHHWMAALVCEKQERWQEAIEAYLQLANNQAHVKACMAKAFNLIAKAQLVDRADAIRLSFEKAIRRLNAVSSFPSPTCFICYNAEESDVKEWLKHTLVPHLDLAGIRPIVCFHALKPGHDVSNFQEMAEGSDLVLIICTSGLKAKCDQSAKAPMGIAQEVRLIKERCSDKDKAGTIFPIFLKGKRKQCLPTAFFGPILGVKLTQALFDFHYFTNAFKLLAAMRQLNSHAVHLFVEEFVQAIKPLVQGQIDRDEVALWRQNQASAHQLLLDTISQRVMQMIKIVNLPLPPANFTGRKEELARLKALCQQHQRVAITGLGGVGKTAFVLHYAHLHQADYALLHFMPAGTPQLIIDGLLKLADDLFVPSSGKIEERLGWLKVALDRRKQDYLLIFDGIDQVEAFHEIDKYLPDKGRCLLLTSRLIEDCHLLQCQPLELQALTLKEAIHYLLVATGSQEEAQAQALAEKLGRLPLALTHAASYIRRRGIGIEHYCQQFDRYQLELFESKHLKLRSAEKTILTTWQMSMDTIVKIHECPLPQDTLAFLAFLAQSAIPLPLVQAWFKIAHPRGRELDLQCAIAYLCDYSMLSSASPGTYHIHVLVQQVTKYQLSLVDQHRTLSQALQACLSITQETDDQSFHVRRQLDPFMPHFKSIVHHTVHHTDVPHMLTLVIRIWKCDYSDGRYQDLEHMARICSELSATQDEKCESLNRLGLSLLHMGKYAEALSFFKETWYIANKAQGKKHLNVAVNNVGVALSELGQHQEALTYKMQALELSKEILGDKHPAVAASLGNVGAALNDLGQHQAALTYKMQALKLRKEILGDKHPDVALSLGNVGVALNDLGQDQEALLYHMQALKLRKEILGDKHPHVAKSLGDVGATLSNLGQHQEALLYHMQALELSKEILGDKHPDVARDLGNVGATLNDLGQYQEALTYHMQALKLNKGILGDKHPHVARSLGGVGATLNDLGQYQEALTYHMQALELSKEVWGDKHPHVAKSLGDVGETLNCLGQCQEALTYHMQALELRKEILGDKHSDVAASLGNVGLALNGLGQYQEALTYHMQALELRKEIWGDKHPDVVIILGGVGLALNGLGQYQEALTYHMQALELSKEVWGDKHPHVAIILGDVGLTLNCLGQYQEALTYHMQALELRKEILGDKHPHVARSLGNVGLALNGLGQYQEALTYHMQALELSKGVWGDKHPHVARSLGDVGETLNRLGQCQEALTYKMQDLELSKEIWGDKHPIVARNLGNVGETLSELGQHQEALTYKMQALKLNKEILGDKHPSVALSLGNVGVALNGLGQHREALPYHMQALKLNKEILGDKHPSVALSLGNVGVALSKLDQHQEAHTYHLQALELRKELLGYKHPDVAKILDNVGLNLGYLGQHQEALAYHLQALELRKELLGDKHPDVAKSLDNVGFTLGKLGQHQEALKYQRQASKLADLLHG